jgi:hypothetical protein
VTTAPVAPAPQFTITKPQTTDTQNATLTFGAPAAPEFPFRAQLRKRHTDEGFDTTEVRTYAITLAGVIVGEERIVVDWRHENWMPDGAFEKRVQERVMAQFAARLAAVLTLAVSA